MSNIRSTLLFVSLIFTAFLLTSCGGSGSSESSNDLGNNQSITLNYSYPSLRLGDTSSHIIGVVTGEGDVDSFGIIGEIDSNGVPVSMSSLV